MKRFIPAVLATIGVFACGSNVPASITVTAAEYGDRWPLIADEAKLLCEAPSALIIEVEGARYALNGKALDKGVPRAEPIKKSPDLIAMADFADRARTLCPAN